MSDPETPSAPEPPAPPPLEVSTIITSSTARQIIRNVLVILAVLGTIYLVYLLRRPLGWLLLATFLAIAVSGPVNLLQRFMRRGAAITLTYLGLLLVPVLLALIVVPPFVNQGTDLVDDVPKYAQDLEKFVQENKTLRELDEKYDVISKLQEKAEELPNRIGDAASLLSDLGLGLVNSGFALFNILILSIFLVNSGPMWAARLVEMQPEHRRDRLDRTLRHIADAVGNYMGGALLQATVAAILTYIVLTILGVPFAAPLAIIVGAFDLIPLIGATIGALAVTVVTLFTDFPTATIVWVLWSVFYQQIENNVIQPQIQRRAVDLHPFVVIMAVLCGSTLFGVLGALLAIPVAAAIQIALLEYLQFRRETKAIEGVIGEPPDPVLPA
jgi:predicted PurR-regulated permease PerM